MTAPLLQAEGLVKSYGRTRVLYGVNLDVRAGETLALVGGSGAGKTTLAKILLRLLEPDAGRVLLSGRDLTALSSGALRSARREIQMVFQDPLAALNPRATIGRLLTDPLRIHNIVGRRERPVAVEALLTRVGLPATFATRYPHQLSGGQRQRVTIARALASRPRVLILDEPVSALDVSIRAQILNLLLEIQRDDDLACLVIAHDLAVVRAVADRMAVLDRGRIVEEGAVEDILATPQAEATHALLAAVPRIAPRSSG